MFSSPVFAGNGLSVESTVMSDIYHEIDFVEKNLLFECKNRILEDLKCIILRLEELKIYLKPQYRIVALTPFLDRLSRILGDLSGLSEEQKEAVNELYRQILYMKMPLAPKISAYRLTDDVEKMINIDKFSIC